MSEHIPVVIPVVLVNILCLKSKRCSCHW
uniref:Uncharacterized protein n=1 Tax=Arundo donax TaxID=35708 RepID=A0A0A9HSU5_ARUDO